MRCWHILSSLVCSCFLNLAGLARFIFRVVGNGGGGSRTVCGEGTPHLFQVLFSLGSILMFSSPFPLCCEGSQRCAATLASRRAAGVRAERSFAGTRLHEARNAHRKLGGRRLEARRGRSPKRFLGKMWSVLRTQLHLLVARCAASPARPSAIGGLRAWPATTYAGKTCGIRSLSNNSPVSNMAQATPIRRLPTERRARA